MNRFVDDFRRDHPDAVLFPNLRSIYWKEGSLGSFPLAFLITPKSKSQRKLQDVNLCFEPKDQSSIFKFITDVRPPLEGLEIHLDSEAEHIACSTTFVDMLEALPRLKSLSFQVPWTWCPNVASELLVNLPSLEKLSVESNAGPPDGHDAGQYPSIVKWLSSAVPSLHHLHLILGLFDWFSTTVRSMPRSCLHLHSLQLCSTSGILAYELKASFEAISHALDPGALRELCFDREDDAGQNELNENLTEITDVFFEPLFAFVNLESLTVECPKLHVGDACLNRMVDAWPNLRRLYIASCSPWFLDLGVAANLDSDPRYITLDGLSYLASSSRNLTSLTWRMNLGKPSSVLREAERAWAKDELKCQDRDNRLEELSVVPYSFLGNAEDDDTLIDVLRDLFPRLHTISTLYDYPPDLVNDCEVLQDLLRET